MRRRCAVETAPVTKLCIAVLISDYFDVVITGQVQGRRQVRSGTGLMQVGNHADCGQLGRDLMQPYGARAPWLVGQGHSRPCAALVWLRVMMDQTSAWSWPARNVARLGRW